MHVQVQALRCDAVVRGSLIAIAGIFDAGTRDHDATGGHKRASSMHCAKRPITRPARSTRPSQP
jgi:hypothetical protein